MKNTLAVNKLVPRSIMPANMQFVFIVLSYVSIAVWFLWWGGNLSRFKLQFADVSWLPIYQFLGLDYYHNHFAAAAWLQGINPYVHDFGDPRGLYSYPPVVLPLFSWVALVPDFQVAARLWALFIAAACACGLWLIRRFRRTEGWSDISVVSMLALVLWSAPVVFAMERGNCDVLVLICVLLAAVALSQSARWSLELLAAVLLALAATIKIYPLMAFVALFALRRYRVMILMGFGIAMLLLPFGEMNQQLLTVAQTAQSSRINPVLEFVQWLRGDLTPHAVGDYSNGMLLWGSLHSPGNWWPALWVRVGIDSIAAWPLLAVQIATLAPVTVWGCWRIFHADDPARLSLPILLWIMTLATFWMPLSHDYNLIFLPLLMLTLWDSREPWWVQALVFMSVPWWLPFGPSGYDWALARVLLKLLSLHVVTLLLFRSFSRQRAL